MSKIVLKTLNLHSSTMLPHNIKVFVMWWKVISKIVFNMSIFWNLQKNMYSFHTFSTQFKKYMKNPLSYFFKPVHNKRISPLVGAPWRPRAAAPAPPPRRGAPAPPRHRRSWYNLVSAYSLFMLVIIHYFYVRTFISYIDQILD